MITTSRCADRVPAAIGVTAPNSRRGETARRYLQSHLPRGCDAEIALDAARATSRVYAEIEGRGAALSMDVALAAVRHLTLEERLRIVAFWIEPLGLQPIPLSVEPIPEG